ncbi:MAG: AraC family transcriptional regulator [Pseudomonadales bacterium]|nr:AraC family transcriptional regulator [Pseudomonadales bacterium]
MTMVQVPNHYLANLEAFAKGRQISAAKLYANTPITPKQASNLNHSVSLQDFVIVIERLRELLKEPHFGLYMGQEISPTSHGDLGFAIMSSSTLDQAVGALLRYFPTRINIVQLASNQVDQRTEITFTESVLLGSIKRPIIDMAISTMVSAFRFLTQQQFRCKEIHLSGSNEIDLETYQRMFGCTIVTDAAADKVVFESRWLNQPLILSDPTAHQLSVEKCEAALQAMKQAPALVEKIRARLMQQQGEFPSFLQLCEELNMSERTLRRKLENQGTPYQQILNETRQELAEFYLKSSNYPLSKIAERLGYSDPSNFGNAFKRWFGMSPSQYRKLNN